MIYTNDAMSAYLRFIDKKVVNNTLDKNLKKILEKGFFRINECIFFVETFPSNYDKESLKENIKDDFLDFSGFEASTNKFHVEDFTDKDPFVQTFIFLGSFKKIWYKSFYRVSITILISFQDDDIGKFATFTFHKNRNNELVYNPKNIDLNSDPVYLEIIS